MKISVMTPSIRPSGLDVVYESLKLQTFQDFEFLVEIGFPERGHDLNASYNRMIKRAKGELFVSLQDFIKIPIDGLEKFWNAYQKDKRTFYTAPVGKVSSWDDKSAVWDWRVYPGADMNWTMWEIDWACAPMSALREIGGFDDELDKFWSFDNVNVGCRADLAGYKFAHLSDNKAIAFDHDAHIKHPFRERYNPDFHNERLDEFRRGLRINYL